MISHLCRLKEMLPGGAALHRADEAFLNPRYGGNPEPVRSQQPSVGAFIAEGCGTALGGDSGCMPLYSHRIYCSDCNRSKFQLKPLASPFILCLIFFHQSYSL